ncbi:hypothetical protein M426DRAFT_325334 [Hypoxylon sp. CI-4A]|nr:hypothetical protein M426DRAFT_325334 [Hypoxylon sp. CI-4A]
MTYVMVYLYADDDCMHTPVARKFMLKSWEFQVPEIFECAVVRQDDVPEVVKRFCKGGKKQHIFVAFREGKHMTVNGKSKIVGSDIGGLVAAFTKLGGLAREQEEQRKDKGK